MWPCSGCWDALSTTLLLLPSCVLQHLQGKLAESRRAPASTAHCFLNGTISVWENSSAKCWNPSAFLYLEWLSIYTWKVQQKLQWPCHVLSQNRCLKSMNPMCSLFSLTTKKVRAVQCSNPFCSHERMRTVLIPRVLSARQKQHNGWIQTGKSRRPTKTLLDPFSVFKTVYYISL